MKLHGLRQWQTAVSFIVLAALAGLSAAAHAQIITLERPPEGEFVIDKAGLIEPDDAAHIRQVCQRLLAEDNVPLIVVVINAMSDHGGAGLRVETFTTLLFDQWGIGNEDKNLGILLLVSKQDRVSRIALGADWDRETDRAAQRIMNDDIIPHFKAGQFSDGIRAGVDALDALVRPREAELPPAAQSAANLASGQAHQPIPSQAVPTRRAPRQPARPAPTTVNQPIRTTHANSSESFGSIAISVLAFPLVIIGVVFSLLKRLFGSGGGGGWGIGGYGSSNWDDSYRSTRHRGSFGGGLFGGGMGGHHDHGGGLFGGGFGGHHGGSSFGGHSGSSFGGGHTGGGGATGRW